MTYKHAGIAALPWIDIVTLAFRKADPFVLTSHISHLTFRHPIIWIMEAGGDRWGTGLGREFGGRNNCI